jgi:branched-chain amino acid transport system substrate-binding protein
MKSKALVLLVCIGLLPVPVAFGGSQKEEANSGKPIKFAVALPMTGDNSEYGKRFLLSAQMMIEKWNSTGGVLGQQIEIVNYDDKNSAEEAASIAQKIVSDKDIIAVLGHFSSGVSMTAAPTYQENKIIEISNCASHPDYSKIGSFIFRGTMVTAFECKFDVNIAANDLKVKNIGVVGIKNDWGHVAGLICSDLINEDPNLNLVGFEEVLETSDDYSPLINKMKAGGAEAIIIMGSYSIYGTLARQYKEVDPNIKFICSTNAFTQQLIDIGGQAVEGLITAATFYSESDDPETKAYVTEFTRHFGMEPSSLDAMAYDCVGMVLQAIKEAGTLNRDTVRDALAKVNYNGVTGRARFDENRDVEKDLIKVVVRNGRFVPL